MGDNQVTMTVDDYLHRNQEIVVIGTLEATEDESRVKLTLASYGATSCCQKSVTLNKDAINEVRTQPGSRVAEIVINEKATFSASEIFGEQGLATCRCSENTLTARISNSATTTVDRCRRCGCWYDGLSCRCGSPDTADCARGLSASPPYIIGVR